MTKWKIFKAYAYFWNQTFFPGRHYRTFVYIDYLPVQKFCFFEPLTRLVAPDCCIFMHMPLDLNLFRAKVANCISFFQGQMKCWPLSWKKNRRNTQNKDLDIRTEFHGIKFQNKSTYQTQLEFWHFHFGTRTLTTVIDDCS